MAECNCIIKHANSKKERKQANSNLDYYRRVGDNFGVMLAVASLAGDCPARKANHGKR